MNEINPQYAPWVKKLLVLKLFSPGSGNAWMDHYLLIHRERKGHMLGSLERDVITEMRTKWSEQALPYLENPSVNERDRAALQKDLEAVKWAGICMDRLSEYDANAWSPEPLESDPASGENDEAKRGETLEPQMNPLIPAGTERDPELQFAEVVSQAPQSTQFEVEEQSQPKLALPPAAPLSRAQDSAAPEPSTRELVDPSFIHTREQFVEACHTVAQRISETENLWEAKRLSGMGEVLRALASTMQLGKEFELWGKALRLRAYFRAAQLQQNEQTNGEKIFDERLIRDLKNLPEKEFEQILTSAVAKGNLADKMFRVSASESTRATPRNNAVRYDPMRFFVAFLADIRTNPEAYSPDQMTKFVQHALVQQNFGPVEQIYIDFSVAFVGAWRAWKAQSQAKV